jgi:hypothetical protein
MIAPRHAEAGFVHAMQEHLDEVWTDRVHRSDRPRWAPRTTMAVASGVSLLLWGAIAVAIAAVR